MRNKGQIWYVDFMVGIMVFSVMLVTYFYYVTHSEYTDETALPTLIADSKAISSLLMSQGYPLNWTTATIEQAGLTDGGSRVNLDKLEDFVGLGYEERKSYMRTTKNYYFCLEYLNGSRFQEVGENGSTSTHLVQTSRFVIHNSTVVKMVLYLHQV